MTQMTQMTELEQMAWALGQQIRRRLRDHNPTMVVYVQDRIIRISDKDATVIVMNIALEDDRIKIDGAPWEDMMHHEILYSDPEFNIDKIMPMVLSASL